jgi:hypothetical protein
MSCPKLAVVPRGTTSGVAAAEQEEALCAEHHVGAGCGVSGWGSPEGHHYHYGRQLPLLLSGVRALRHPAP